MQVNVTGSAGRLPFRGIIHVAGIGLTWHASERSIRLSVRNALALATREGFRSLAFPLIGAGTGGQSVAGKGVGPSVARSAGKRGRPRAAAASTAAVVRRDTPGAPHK
jgi:hypothetical protein